MPEIHERILGADVMKSLIAQRLPHVNAGNHRNQAL